MTQTSSIQAVIDEIKNLAPDISTAFVFTKEGEIVANTKDTPSEQTHAVAANLGNINAQAIGGIESFTIQGINSQICITAVNDVFFATVSSRAGKQEAVASITQVVVPTVIRLATHEDKEVVKKKEMLQTATPTDISILPVDQEPQSEPVPEPPAPVQPFLPKAPNTQFMVEKIGGLLVAQDVVRIDGEVVAEWCSLCGERELTHVKIETLEGKSVTCKFKLQKAGKSNIQGVIQIPDKILQALQCDKGKLVMVKPVVSEEC